MKALEVTGTVNEQGQLSIDAPLAVNQTSRVRVIITSTLWAVLVVLLKI